MSSGVVSITLVNINNQELLYIIVVCRIHNNYTKAFINELYTYSTVNALFKSWYFLGSISSAAKGDSLG